MQPFHRLVPKPAFGHIDDAFKRQIICRLRHQPQIGQRVADFSAFVETETANDAIGQANGDEAVLELAGLELRANQYGDTIERQTFTLQPCDVLADAPRFFGRVPHADDTQLFAR